ncbi:hypothetical protein BJX65DRAFT_291303 [Aspergillus insuetus]
MLAKRHDCHGLDPSCTIWPCHIASSCSATACSRSATALPTTSSAILLDLSLSSSKLFVHSSWPS